MANIQERRNKDGKLISYSIRVHRGRGSDGKQLKPWTTTFEVSPTWTEKSARKKAEAFAAIFEKECRQGITSDNRQTFQSYCDYALALKESRGAKHSTIVRYRELTARIYPAIGHIKLKDLRADHLNTLYTDLGREGSGAGSAYAVAKVDLIPILKKKSLTRTAIADTTGVSIKAVYAAVKVQPEQVADIRNALEEEPIKWRTITHLFLITGARRGEILGLKWDKVDFEGSKIHICNNVLYSPDRGIYEDTPKTATSDRYISLPPETMRLGEYYENQDFVFSQDNGNPMHPDSVTDWLKKFSKRHGLPHINPHAFRYTMASMLIFVGVDNVSISKRLGHAQVSATADIYAHVMAEADKKSADILADVLLKNG